MTYQMEALDRTHVAIETISTHILEHPFTQEHRDVYLKIEQALDALAQAYQIIGNKDDK